MLAKKRKDMLTLGAKEEVISYDFTNMGWEAKDIMEYVHDVMYSELVGRNIQEVYPWSTRTKNVFLYNSLSKVGMVVNAKLENINNFANCGFKVRLEIYEVFKKELNMDLKQWNPEHYWEKFNFVNKKRKDRDKEEME